MRLGGTAGPATDVAGGAPKPAPLRSRSGRLGEVTDVEPISMSEDEADCIEGDDDGGGPIQWFRYVAISNVERFVAAGWERDVPLPPHHAAHSVLMRWAGPGDPVAPPQRIRRARRAWVIPRLNLSTIPPPQRVGSWAVTLRKGVTPELDPSLAPIS